MIYLTLGFRRELINLEKLGMESSHNWDSIWLWGVVLNLAG